jgi:bacillithiol biosynthesis cysteine-adding enzyme BshC
LRFQSVQLPVSMTAGSIYYSNFERKAPFFPGGNPHESDTFKERYRFLTTNDNPAVKEEVAGVLTAYNRSLGAGPESLANAAKLAEPGTVAIVTGQQAGLLTGPLLTIYKAMTAIALADRYREELGVEVVPVFWIASEDHDYQEINHLHLLGEKERCKTVYLPYPVVGQPPMQWVPAGKACQQLLQECLRLFRPGPFWKEAEKLLKDTLAGTENICDWFGAILLKLFKGLVCINPMLPELRRLQQPVFRRGIEQVEEINQLLADNEAQLTARGITPAVQKKRNHTHLFLLDQGNRVPIMAHEEGFQAGDRYLSFQELKTMIEYHPEAFSPDVILRPLTQEVLLPVLAYVAGPGEFDYWAQLAGVFDHFGLKMPAIYPRASLTLVEPEIEELLAAYEIAPEQVFDNLELHLDRLLIGRDSIGLDRLFRQGEQELETIFQRLQQELGATMAGKLAETGERALSRTLREWQRLKKRAWQEHRKQHGELVNDFRAIALQLLPGGNTQESTYNLFSYYTVYGPEMLRQLMPGILGSTGHQFVFLGG